MKNINYISCDDIKIINQALKNYIPRKYSITDDLEDLREFERKSFKDLNDKMIEIAEENIFGDYR